MQLSLNKNILIALNNLTAKFGYTGFNAINKLTCKLAQSEYKIIPYNIHSNFIYSALNKLVKSGYASKHTYKNDVNKFKITSDGIDFLKRTSKLAKPVVANKTEPARMVKDKIIKDKLIDYTIKSKKITVKVSSNIINDIIDILTANNSLKTGSIAYHLITDYKYTVSQSLLKKVVNSIVYKTTNKSYFHKDKITNKVVLSA